jgi:glycosyltransferase involved in cell wall biosynthesis
VRILQVSDSLEQAFGGTAAACAHLSNHLAAGGVDVAVMTPQPVADAASWPLDSRVTARQCRPKGPFRLMWRLGPLTDAPAVIRSLLPIDVAHIHGLWRMPYLQTARAARECRTPVVVSVHGMLHPTALEQRSLAKRAFRWLVQDTMLFGNSHCLHATARDEADILRRAGYGGPIAIIPWGIDAPHRQDRRSPVAERLLVYLGRLHPSKGLDALLTAWANVERQFPAWKLLLAGYDEGGYRGTLEARVRELRITARVSFSDPVAGDEREALFANASLVVLPSPAENFGLVVPEALVRGIPVIATTGAPWAALQDERCGWWTDADVDSLAAALKQALSIDDATRQEMGERGRQFALPRFSWERIASRMIELYEWLSGRRASPEFLVT